MKRYEMTIRYGGRSLIYTLDTISEVYNRMRSIMACTPGMSVDYDALMVGLVSMLRGETAMYKNDVCSILALEEVGADADLD